MFLHMLTRIPHISPGNATTDKTFLLSIIEAHNYFSNNDDRKADATQYALKQGASVKGSESVYSTSDGSCTDVHCYAEWWLRSPGKYTSYKAGAARIQYDGNVDYVGNSVGVTYIGIRPAMWVNYP